MNFRKRRRERQAKDREYEKAAGVKHSDPIATRHAGGNTYSRADIEMLEREHTQFWRRRKR